MESGPCANVATSETLDSTVDVYIIASRFGTKKFFRISVRTNLVGRDRLLLSEAFEKIRGKEIERTDWKKSILPSPRSGNRVYLNRGE